MKKRSTFVKNNSSFNSGQFVTIMREAQKELSELTPEQRSNLEKRWDVEHAYYSSSLEGSKVDKKEFEDMAKGMA